MPNCMGYKSRLEEGVPCISITAAVTVPKETAADQYIQYIREGWDLKCAKKAYRVNEQQKAYLNVTFAIGQTTGKTLDGDIVAREMRRWPFQSLRVSHTTANLVLLLASWRQNPPTTSQWCRYQDKWRRRQLCSSKGNCQGHYTSASHHVWSVWHFRHGKGCITRAIKT